MATISEIEWKPVMGRRSEDNLLDLLFDVLIRVPAWVGPTLSGITFATMWWLLPWVYPDGPHENVAQLLVGNIVRHAGPLLAPLFAGLILLVWGRAEWVKLRNRRRLDAQTAIESIRHLSWQEIEELLSEAFRRLDYDIEHTGKAGPDGGVDHRLWKDDRLTLVQCKHWKREQVGVAVVRELLGVMTGDAADAGMIVTSRSLTREAEAFARQNRIQVVDATELTRLIRSVQRSPAAMTPNSSKSSESPAPACPQCGSVMTRKVARKGKNAGSEFWGCSRFPECQGTRGV